MARTSLDNKYRSLISTGLKAPLGSIPFHMDGPIDRRLFTGPGVRPEAPWHVAVHMITDVDVDKNRDYCVPHGHDCDELNLFLSSGKLSFRITLGDESYVLEAPTSVFIPAGLMHSANVIAGTGFFICMVDSSDYENSLLTPDGASADRES